jgi:DNA helicase-2/ATP-dependent DNA helicase PcrA
VTRPVWGGPPRGSSGFADFDKLGGEEVTPSSKPKKKRGVGVKPATKGTPQWAKQQDLFTVKNWSKYQQDIFRDVVDGKGHVGILARAGSGKTTVIISSLDLIPKGKTALMVTFNKEVVKKLKSEAPKGVDALTIHGYGYRELKRAGMARDEDLSFYKTMEIADKLFPTMRNNKDLMSSLSRAVDLAKCELIPFEEGLNDVINPGFSRIEEIIERFGIDDIEDAPGGVGGFINAVLAVLKKSAEMTDTIDYGDMVWLPIYKNIPVKQYDFIFIDEGQDFSMDQVELALRACKPDVGRIFAVGDPFQAIYQFRSASDYMALIKRLNARILPLPISYRCAKSIIREAQKLVPDIEAAPNAPEGEVHHNVSMKTMIDGAEPGDFVLSRTNAPLVGLCMAFLSAGKPANIKGRDIGKNLAGMIRRSKARDVETFLKWVDAWETKEKAKLLSRKPVAGDTQMVEDRATCLRTLSKGVTDLSQVTMRVTSFFSDDEEKETSHIVLSTTHKAKGLESDCVWVLQDTYKPEHPNQEEANLLYVAITRAKTSLFFVRTPNEKRH